MLLMFQKVKAWRRTQVHRVQDEKGSLSGGKSSEPRGMFNIM